MCFDVDSGQRPHGARHMLGLDPVFEGGWRRRGRRARRWDAEGRITAVALFGDVTVDLAGAHSVPSVVEISAWALFRDVTILVAPGTHVDVVGDSFIGEVHNAVPALPQGFRRHTVRVECHGVIGDVDVEVAAA